MKTHLKLLLPVALAFGVSACAATGAVVSPAAVDIATPGTEASRTTWNIHPSLGLDALVFLGALSGDALQSDIYAEEAAMFRARLTDDERAALDRLGATARATGSLVGPFMTLLFSVGKTETFDDILASADAPEAQLRPEFERTPYWDEEQWPSVRDAVRGDVALVLRGLRRAEFESYWRVEVEPATTAGVARYVEALAQYDVIAEQQRLLGRALEPEIELVLLHFSKPYGIRITGQRFISFHDYDPHIQLRTAAHEIFHPPFDLSDEDRLASLTTLRADPWMVSIVEDHNPSFGYNSFAGVLDEDSTEALDQIVSERLGFAYDAGLRWARHDGGMHMLAAALYRAMKNDRFDETGGVYQEWLQGAIARGVLAPENVKRLAAEVVGQDAVDAWGPHRASAGDAGTAATGAH